MFGNESGVVEAAFSDVAINGGERNNDGWSLDGRKSCIENIGKGASESAYGLIFEVVNELTDEVGAITDDKNGWKALAVWTLAGGGRSRADGTVITMIFDNVFFTTIAKWPPQRTTTPTRVGGEEVYEADKCCVFYNIWHDSLDFTIELIYNKA